MYYLRKETYEKIIPEIVKTDGTIIPKRVYKTGDRAVYKATDVARFYRQPFMGIKTHPKGMRLYTCKRLKTILALRQATFDYCGEWFDVYDENGKVDLEQDGEDE